jgi:nitroimidazol reductase NimA-like FMN-containing flavoprotein (pyridoxamine 5'-phosphate oxidase superfamily)
MRRKEKEIIDTKTLEEILNQARVLRLGLIDGERPYIVPVCFGFSGDTLYVHGALKGRKMDLIQDRPEVCFEVETGVEVLASDAPCNWSVRFRSIIGYGLARVLDDPDEKAAALGIIMARYAPDRAEPWIFPENAIRGTAVVRIDITSMTGKQSGY